MQIKTFEANSMAEALQAAKAAFGSDAVILGVKTHKASPRLLGKWKRRKVSLTAAIDTSHPGYDTVSISNTGNASAGSKPDIGNIRPAVQTYSSPVERSPSKHMLPSGYINKMFWMQQQMHQGGVDREIARELMINLHQVAVRQTQLSDASLLALLKEEIIDRIRRKPTQNARRNQTQPVVFLGPTGVGKTTTIAKIATLYNRKQPSSVGLITLDDQRIGGMSQLATYARIIGIPARAASSPASLQKALTILAGKRLLLVDTGGVSPHDQQQIDRLEALLLTMHRPRIHLVLSTTTKSNDLNRMVDAFKQLPIQDLLFTKVDESTTQGNILSQSLRSGLPLSYYTDGRDIPNDIHLMTADNLIKMIFNPMNLRRAKTAAPEILAQRLQAFEDELDTIPMTYDPYRTYSTKLDNMSGGYTTTAQSMG